MFCFESKVSLVSLLFFNYFFCLLIVILSLLFCSQSILEDVPSGSQGNYQMPLHASAIRAAKDSGLIGTSEIFSSGEEKSSGEKSSPEEGSKSKKMKLND